MYTDDRIQVFNKYIGVMRCPSSVQSGWPLLRTISERKTSLNLTWRLWAKRGITDHVRTMLQAVIVLDPEIRRI